MVARPKYVSEIINSVAHNSVLMESPLRIYMPFSSIPRALNAPRVVNSNRELLDMQFSGATCFLSLH
jgi:hypothetical protein